MYRTILARPPVATEDRALHRDHFDRLPPSWATCGPAADGSGRRPCRIVRYAIVRSGNRHFVTVTQRRGATNRLGRGGVRRCRTAGLVRMAPHGLGRVKPAGQPLALTDLKGACFHPGVRWPISPADAIVIIRAAPQVLPMFVAPEAANFQGTYEISLRGGPIIAMSFYDGRLTFAEGKATRPDCCVSANPSSFLLSALGRLGLWSPAFKGQMLAYGRKPWLAFRLPSLLRQL
jgi:hypothetical protein